MRYRVVLYGRGGDGKIAGIGHHRLVAGCLINSRRLTGKGIRGRLRISTVRELTAGGHLLTINRRVSDPSAVLRRMR